MITGARANKNSGPITAMEAFQMPHPPMMINSTVAAARKINPGFRSGRKFCGSFTKGIYTINKPGSEARLLRYPAGIPILDFIGLQRPCRHPRLRPAARPRLVHSQPRAATAPPPPTPLTSYIGIGELVVLELIFRHLTERHAGGRCQLASLFFRICNRQLAGL